MSRIGRQPVEIPAGVTATITGRDLTVVGPKGSLSLTVVEPIIVSQEDGALLVTRPDDERDSRARHGLTRTLVANMVTGVTTGYEKGLEIVGTGYRVAAKGTDLELLLGFSHPVVVKAPEGISFEVESPIKFKVKGIDKQKVGEVAANIRKIRKPEPYKGKGVRYEGEVVRRKAGKAGKTGVPAPRNWAPAPAQAWGVRVVTCACARRSRARQSVPGWSSPDRLGTCWSRSSTTARA